MDDEIRWKEQLHARWTTPDTVVDELVRRASGSAAGSRQRIIGGEGNEVWFISTVAGDDLVVRISHETTFAAERWATEHAGLAGAPVPEILLVDDDITAGDRHIAVWIHRAITGRPLVTIEDEQTARKLSEQAGELLACIHDVRTAGYGFLDAHGRGQCGDFSAAMEWDEHAVGAALANGISLADLDRAAGLLETFRHIWATPPRLLHGDWLPEHVLVHDGSVAGIIDFGGARSGDPAYDIAYWQFFWDGERFPQSSMVQGYRRASDTGALFDLRVCLCRLGMSMRAVSLYAQNGRGFPAQHSARRFGEALAWLRAEVT